MSTTTVVAEKIRLKIIERNARDLVSFLSGVRAEISPAGEDFKSHRDIFSKTCAIDAKPEIIFVYPVNKDEIINWICEKVGRKTENLIMPFERLVFIRLNVVNMRSFANSLFNYMKTFDMVLYSIDPSFVIAIHDGEYEVHCFYCPVQMHDKQSG
jgi:hypothetical protein